MLAKQLEERKLALQEKLATHRTSQRQDQASTEQIQERKFAAKNKAQAMAQKRKLDTDSDNDFDGSGRNSSSSDSGSEAYGSVNDPKIAADASGPPPADTREKSQEDLSTLSKKKRT